VIKERSFCEVPCPHCGAEAHWRFLYQATNVVEVFCPNCGRFELTRAKFERSESDTLNPKQAPSDSPRHLSA
jgi:predicted RNA-binding Zn-ribbon protein involved in translation (DUF1610 family)